ncbi:MAG: OmpH family outer membrane protein [Flavobacteriales bacterium]|jgi:outer membrane protein|nr:OmpH family outer membrane protein [Flavobacteriales bacterium]
MKRLLTVLMVCATVLVAQAQEKIGYINSSEILEMLPETASARKKVEAVTKKKQTQLKSLENELKSKYDAFNAEAATMTESVATSRKSEILTLEKKIKAFYEESQKTLMKAETDALKPLIEKVQKAINAVAKGEGYTYIIDMAVSNGFIVFAAKKKDVTPSVKKQLGL